MAKFIDVGRDPGPTEFGGRAGLRQPLPHTPEPHEVLREMGWVDPEDADTVPEGGTGELAAP